LPAKLDFNTYNDSRLFGATAIPKGEGMGKDRWGSFPFRKVVKGSLWKRP